MLAWTLVGILAAIVGLGLLLYARLGAWWHHKWLRERLRADPHILKRFANARSAIKLTLHLGDELTRLGQSRRLSKDYERLPATSQAMI